MRAIVRASQVIAAAACLGAAPRDFLAFGSLVTPPLAEREPPKQPGVSQERRPVTETALLEILARHSGFTGTVTVRADESVVTCSQGTSRGKEIRKETLFPIGSLAKLFSAAWIISRVDPAPLGECNALGKPLSEIKPGIAWGRLGSATLRDLLHHRGGIVGDAPGRVDPWQGPEYFAAVLASENAKPATLKPGAKTIYSNVGYSLAAFVVSDNVLDVITGLKQELLPSPKFDGIRFWGDPTLSSALVADAGSTPTALRDQFLKTPSWNNIACNGMLADGASLVEWHRFLLTPGGILTQEGLNELLSSDPAGFGSGCMVRYLPDGQLVIANTGSDRDGNPSFLAGNQSCSVAVLSCIPPKRRANAQHRDFAYVALSASLALVDEVPAASDCEFADRYVGNYASEQGRITIAKLEDANGVPSLRVSGLPNEITSAIAGRGVDKNYTESLKVIAEKFIQSGFGEPADSKWRSDRLDWSPFIHQGKIRSIFPGLEEFLSESKGQVEIVGTSSYYGESSIHYVFLRRSDGVYAGLAFAPNDSSGRPEIQAASVYGKELPSSRSLDRLLLPAQSGNLYAFDLEARVPTTRITLLAGESHRIAIKVGSHPEFILTREGE